MVRTCYVKNTGEHSDYACDVDSGLGSRGRQFADFGGLGPRGCRGWSGSGDSGIIDAFGSAECSWGKLQL